MWFSQIYAVSSIARRNRMPRRKTQESSQADIPFVLEEHLNTAPCVPAIRQAVNAWRADNYKGVTATTRELLNFWFATDHRLANGTPFRYHAAQREAIETLIYLYEVAGVRRRKALLTQFAFQTKDLRLPPYDDFARYCIKMATGSGKTLVMALSIVWQFANACRENVPHYAKTFLILAPNIIVFDRLRSDFESGLIFRRLPLIPKHFQFWWDMAYYMRGDPERPYTQGALYLTNIQQFYARPDGKTDAEPDVMTAVLGSPPPTSKSDLSDFDARIITRDGCLMVLNDEAHHTHDEESEWNLFIRRLHQKTTPLPPSLNKEGDGGDLPYPNLGGRTTPTPSLSRRGVQQEEGIASPLLNQEGGQGGGRVAAQLDFSATPRYSKGSLFAWTIFDYPLKQAILDGIVKRPIKGIAKIDEAKSDLPEVQYRGYLVAAVERWKEYTDQLTPLRKKPILFVMLNDTHEADQIGAWLAETYPQSFAGDKLLVIHTNRSGDVAVKDLETARKTAHDVDAEHSPVNAIVSVLMLREGWDVQNVTVVVGLRPYSAKAEILPDQTIGRGLRLMFRDLAENYVERVDIIGNKAFMEFVEDLEKLENVKFDTFQLGKDKLTIITIQPLPERQAYDLSIPDISPLIGRKKSLADEIAAIDVLAFDIPKLPLHGKEIEDIKTFPYEGRDILTDETLLQREYQIPPAQTPEEVIGYYARRITQNIKLPSQFAALTPKVREFFECKAFGKTIELHDPQVIKAMSTNLAAYVVIDTFEKVLRALIVEPKTPELLSANHWLSTTPPFPTSKKIFDAKKTVFNYTPCANDYEYAFAQFLDQAEDVTAFAKLPEQFGFCIQYTDTLANIRNYFPDFIAKTDDDSHWVLETKGREDVDVQHKDRAARNWCQTAAILTGKPWNYMKVPQKAFEGLHPETFVELLIGVNPPS